MGEQVKYGAVILGHERFDVLLTVDTRVAYVESFDMSAQMAKLKPEGPCEGVLVGDAIADHIDIVDGWRLNKFVHNEVLDAHGPVTWGYSKGRTAPTLEGGEAPILWAWDADERLVCIAAPITRKVDGGV